MQKPIDVLSQALQSKKIPVKVESEGRASIEVEKKDLVQVAKVLKDLGFDHVKAVTGIDYPDQGRIQVVYHVSSYSDVNLAKVIVALKTWTNYKELEVPSLMEVWKSAWTGERETYEMLGVKFSGNPDMKRLFLPEDFEGVYPLRKSYKIKTEGLFVDRPS
ncbi:NADH/F420H2 dehydrogenase, subunit C [Metallosphaera yellowstonensis MK1]|uniref:NADH/F420H2 dehydrogenase, subunit C n=1 Tax=Metallosphaera yellowstonensis MK1 TaxID=671065 RepID=H2C9I0_9CREN|nr:NADH-quinone oxidoreductase subunit C [Metallosphaera yellowstonensis]EHP68806.1 NADH/F420H2 dehydrogenase, subunit C [Metallosphaera yellowstonensis MK1]